MPTPSGHRKLRSWARAAEDAGFGSLWVSDHIMLPAQSQSAYPFSADGRADWSMDGDWYDPVVQLALVAASTEQIVLGTAILIAPIRHPYVVARQFASLDRLFPGRLVLGIGAGWLAEEFDAMGVDFRRRGALTDDWVRAVRTAWSGSVPAGVNRSYPAKVPMHSRPVPVNDIEIVIGGTSGAALRRAATLGDGWMAHEAFARLDLADLGRSIDELRRHAGGRHPRILLRLVGTANALDAVAEIMPDLAALGVDELIVDPPTDLDPARLADAAAALALPSAGSHSDV
ncbi:TIGR03619 family F420-dependent LLM class oxidoreductase [Microbacterium sp. 18062]|uniref:TIGR03619 family F420-dependent LLM class oxidoreductase n=1 Tax=Microbacterium sp. 18062 TaxID=2681410 RepID=UPI001F2E7319|nr:TIGR03619 family F420-dependent LLM class oxidoreductase [Microbacterium sp. 18062]